MRGFASGTSCWIDVDAVGVFRFDASGPVRVLVAPASDEVSLQDIWVRSVLPLVLQSRGTEVLHASALLLADGSLLALAGKMLAGKSSLAAASAQQNGLTVAADDALPFDFDGTRVVAAPIPFRLRLREPSAQVLGTAPVSESVALPASPLRAVVLLDPHPSGIPEYSRLDPATAVGALMPHAYCFSLDSSRERLLDNYVRLCRGVPVWRFTYPQRIERLTEVVDCLVTLPE